MHVLIAASRADGHAWLEAQPVAPNDVVIVTPRSPDAARGHTAVAVLATPDAIAHPRYAHLVEVCRPCCMAPPLADWERALTAADFDPDDFERQYLAAP